MKYRVEDELAARANLEANVFAWSFVAIVVGVGAALAHFAFGVI